VKHNLLAQCGIAYVVINASKLPNPDELRNDFLGEAAARSRDLQREQAAVAAARANLQKTLVQQRDKRHAPHDYRDSTSSSMPTDWHDSFLIQSNSMPSELRHTDGRQAA
jgi:hypothetical protein